jgi:RNA polymerase sigma-70 factor (ECF subfamily)
VYLEPLLGYAFSLVGTREMAEDIAQDVLCWLWYDRLSIRVQGSLRSYLFAAVRHRAIDHFRRVSTEINAASEFAGDDDIPAMATPERATDDRTLRNELTTSLRRAVDQLPIRRREIVLLRWRQLSNAEIAEIMGISIKTVEAQVTRAFETLRESLAHLMR